MLNVNVALYTEILLTESFKNSILKLSPGATTRAYLTSCPSCRYGNLHQFRTYQLGTQPYPLEVEERGPELRQRPFDASSPAYLQHRQVGHFGLQPALTYPLLAQQI